MNTFIHTPPPQPPNRFLNHLFIGSIACLDLLNYAIYDYADRHSHWTVDRLMPKLSDNHLLTVVSLSSLFLRLLLLSHPE